MSYRVKSHVPLSPSTLAWSLVAHVNGQRGLVFHVYYYVHGYCCYKVFAVLLPFFLFTAFPSRQLRWHHMILTGTSLDFAYQDKRGTKRLREKEKLISSPARLIFKTSCHCNFSVSFSRQLKGGASLLPDVTIPLFLSNNAFCAGVCT